MKFSKPSQPKPNPKPLPRSSFKQNKNIISNTDKSPPHLSCKTTTKKIKHSQFRLFNELPSPRQLKFDPPHPPTLSTTYSTENQKLQRSLELVFKLLDSKRKGILYNDNLNISKLSPAVCLILSPIFAHASNLEKHEGFTLKEFKQQAIQSGLSQQLYQLIFMTEE